MKKVSEPGRALLTIPRDELRDLLGLPKDHGIKTMQYDIFTDTLQIIVEGPDLPPPMPFMPLGSPVEQLFIEWEMLEDRPQYRERRIVTKGYNKRTGTPK